MAAITMTPTQSASMWSVLCECTLFGIYTLLVGLTLWRSKTRFVQPSPALRTVLWVYAVTVGRIAVDLITLQRLLFEDNGPPGRPDYILRVFDVIFTALSMIGADCLLIWRCYVIWFGSYKILIAPVFLVAVGIANTGVLLALNVLSAYDDDGQTRTVLYDKLLLLGCAISIAVNVFLTGAIVLKLWMTGTRTKTRFYLPFILIFVESGAIQTAGILFYVIASLAGNLTAVIYGIAATNVILGIGPTLIILQLSAGFAQPGDCNEMSVITGTRIVFAASRKNNDGPEEVVPGQPVVIRSRAASVDRVWHRQSAVPRVVVTSSTPNVAEKSSSDHRRLEWDLPELLRGDDGQAERGRKL